MFRGIGVSLCLSLFIVFVSSIGQSEWNQLKITFGKFDALPLNSKDAATSGWTPDASCSDKPRNYFQGYRYVEGGDNTTRLLYDCDGYIAGIQATITHTSFFPTKHNSRPWHRNPDGTVTATAYFRDPKRICRCRKKTCKPKNKAVIGDRLWIQLEKGGKKKSRHRMMEIPLTVANLKNTLWVEGECVRAMGVHYHYNISKEFNCAYALPVFLLVGKQSGKVLGFGWAAPLHVVSGRWEHPPPSIFGRSIKPKDMPKCIANYKSVSVQHIYFVDPLAISC